MTKIGIILGSTRPGRNGKAVAHWVHQSAAQRGDAEFELVDLVDYKLPLLDEAYPRRWASTPSRTPRPGRRRSRPWTDS